MTKIIEIHYAYPSSITGGKNGCYYSTTFGSAHRTKYSSEHVAVMTSVDTGAAVWICYGPTERADKFRRYGIRHCLDGPSTQA